MRTSRLKNFGGRPSKPWNWEPPGLAQRPPGPFGPRTPKKSGKSPKGSSGPGEPQSPQRVRHGVRKKSKKQLRTLFGLFSDSVAHSSPGPEAPGHPFGLCSDSFGIPRRGLCARLGGSQPWKNKHLRADIHDPNARTSMTPGDAKKTSSRKSKNRKQRRQRGVRQSPLSTIESRYGNSVSTAWMHPKPTTKLGLN